jgi:hypothetical protein
VLTASAAAAAACLPRPPSAAARTQTCPSPSPYKSSKSGGVSCFPCFHNTTLVKRRVFLNNKGHHRLQLQQHC